MKNTQKPEQGRLSTKYLEVSSSKTPIIELEGFQFRWLEIEGTVATFLISITLFSNHPK